MNVSLRASVTRTVLATAGAVFTLLAYMYVTLPDVRPLAHVNPSTTAMMELRQREAAAAGRSLPHHHTWVPYNRISSHLKRAVLVAEDDAFWDHEGVDLVQLRRAIEDRLETGEPMRGASTITQQLAKNLYLSPSRNPLRKFRELVITRRLEAALTKERILELYLNLIEWGNGVWGAEAASRQHFGQAAAALTRDQAALLAAVIINPRVLNPAKPTRGVVRRQQLILGRMGDVTPPSATPVLSATLPPVVEDADLEAPDVDASPVSVPEELPLDPPEAEATEGAEGIPAAAEPATPAPDAAAPLE